MKSRFFLILTTCFIIISLSLTAFAHSGRTDASGGHKDNKNKSGLGSYHYHCGGYPAHLHPGGVCPYKGSGTTSSGGGTSSSSGTTYSSAPKTVYATSITPVNVPSKVNAGDTVELKASVYPSSAEDSSIFWESSDSSILKVSSTGTLQAIGVGTATITAKTSRGTSQKFTITVCEVFAESISIGPVDTEIFPDDTKTLSCTFVPENTTNKTIVWSSSDDNIISVSKNGMISAKNVGTATITATHNELTSSIIVSVNPINAKSVKIIFPDNAKTNDSGQIKISKGSTLQLETEISPKNTTYKEIKWSVNDENIATIDKNGVLTAHQSGTITVTATAKSGVSTNSKIEIYSHTAGITTGIVGAAVIACGALFYKKRKEAA